MTLEHHSFDNPTPARPLNLAKQVAKWKPFNISYQQVRWEDRHGEH